MAENLDLQINAQDNASKVLSGVEDKMKSLGSSVKSSTSTFSASFDSLKGGASQVAKGFGQLQSAWTGFVGVMATGFIGSQAMEMMKWRDSVQDIREAFNSTFPNAKEMIDEVSKSIKGTVSNTDLMKNINAASMKDIKFNTEQMSRMWILAKDRAEAMGIGTTEAFESITRGISSAQERSLRNIGVVIDTEKAYENAGKATGKNGKALDEWISNLSDAEKRQIVMNEVLSKYGDTIDKAKAKEADFGDKVQQTEVKFNKLKASIADAMIPTLDNLLTKLSEVSDWFIKLDPSVQSFIANAAIIATVLVPISAIIGAIGSALAGLVNIGIGLATMVTSLGGMATAFAPIAAGASLAVAPILALAGAFGVIVALFGNEMMQAPFIFNEIVMLIIGSLNKLRGEVDKAMMTIAKTIITSIISFVSETASGMARFYSYVGAGMLSAVNAVISGMGKFISSVASGLANVISKVVSFISNFISNFQSIDLMSIGSQIINGLLSGLSNAWSGVVSWVTEKVNWIKNAFAGATGFDVHSPSKWAIWLGQMLMQGLSDGMEKGVGGVLGVVNLAVGGVKGSISILNTTFDTTKMKMKDLESVIKTQELSYGKLKWAVDKLNSAYGEMKSKLSELGSTNLVGDREHEMRVKGIEREIKMLELQRLNVNTAKMTEEEATEATKKFDDAIEAKRETLERLNLTYDITNGYQKDILKNLSDIDYTEMSFSDAQSQIKLLASQAKALQPLLESANTTEEQKRLNLDMLKQIQEDAKNLSKQTGIEIPKELADGIMSSENVLLMQTQSMFDTLKEQGVSTAQAISGEFAKTATAIGEAYTATKQGSSFVSSGMHTLSGYESTDISKYSLDQQRGMGYQQYSPLKEAQSVTTDKSIRVQNLNVNYSGSSLGQLLNSVGRSLEMGGAMA